MTVKTDCAKCFRFHADTVACPPPPVTAVLPVTGAVVPAAAAALVLKITGEMNTRDGVAFSAEVRHDGRLIGTIEDDGRGGGTYFHNHRHADADFFAALVDDYAAIGEDHRWVAHEGLCNDLYEEVAMVRDMNRKRNAVVRLDKDNTQILTFNAKWTDPRLAPHVVSKYGDRAEMWVKGESRWAPVTA